MTTMMSNQVELAVETRQLLSLGRQEKWSFQVLGQAPMPEKPIRLGEWLVTPAEIDTSVIPARALTRIQAIFAAGIRPQGFVLVHEAPKLLPSPDARDKPQNTLAIPHKNTWSGRIGQTSNSTDQVLSVISSLAAVAVAVFALIAAFVIPAMLLAASSGLDPILVAVTEDGYWIEIDRWINE